MAGSNPSTLCALIHLNFITSYEKVTTTFLSRQVREVRSHEGWILADRKGFSHLVHLYFKTLKFCTYIKDYKYIYLHVCIIKNNITNAHVSTTSLRSDAVEDAVYHFPNPAPHILCPWGKPLADFFFCHSLVFLYGFTACRSAQPMSGLLSPSDTHNLKQYIV